MNVSAENLREQIVAVLRAWGISPDAADVSADVMVDTDLAGIDSHGVGMLNNYEELLSRGHINKNARHAILRESPTTALIDADAGLGHPVAVVAMEMAIRKAQACGIGAIAVFNSGHFGATGYYARMASNAGLLGMVTTTTRLAAVTPTYSADRLLGTNPIAFAAPAARNRSFVLDMSTSTTAVNKVYANALRGKALPPGWFLDGNGLPVTDSTIAAHQLRNENVGGLSPLGGTPEMASHKGYGLALMVQILAGTLSGSVFTPIRKKTQKTSQPDDIGHFFMAIDPKAFREPGVFEHELDETIDEIRHAKAIHPDQPILIPGDPEALEREHRLREGIPIPETLDRQIRAICERSGAAYVLKAR